MNEKNDIVYCVVLEIVFVSLNNIGGTVRYASTTSVSTVYSEAFFILFWSVLVNEIFVVVLIVVLIGFMMNGIVVNFNNVGKMCLTSSFCVASESNAFTFVFVNVKFVVVMMM